MLGAWAVVGALVLTPSLLRRMARRQSGSQVAGRPRGHAAVGQVSQQSEGVHNRIALLRAEQGVTRRDLADGPRGALPDRRLPRAR